MLKSGLLAFLRNPKRGKIRLKIPSETRLVKKVSSRILGGLASYDLDEGKVFDIKLCIEEAVRNAMVHGNHSNRNRAVTVTYWVEDPNLTIEVADEGPGFDHTLVADPTIDPHILKNCGRGVYLIRKLMDRADYNRAGNVLTMVKNLR